MGISTEPEVMQMAAERLLGLTNDQIEDLVKDIVYGQMRLIVSNMTIEELNSERDKFLEEVKNVVGGELRKIGLHLINVNITDIRDEAGYIIALGQKDKAIALNKANVEIAKAEKDGATQTAEQNKIKNSEVAATQRTRDINVAAARAEGEIGKIEAEKTVTDKNAELEVVRAEAEKTANTARVRAAAEVAKEEELAQAEAEKASLKAQADGFREMIEAAQTDPAIAIQFKMVQEGTYENIARL